MLLRATDGGGLYTEKQFEVFIKRVANVPIFITPDPSEFNPAFSLKIRENTTDDTVIYRFKVSYGEADLLRFGSSVVFIITNKHDILIHDND